MPKPVTQYRVFIASPGGLKPEREGFREKLQRFTAVHSEPRGVQFYPVGWEDTLGGAGRPQELINEDLKQCDYAVFVLHDRWGSPTGSGYASGTEEEWSLAESLYQETKLEDVIARFGTATELSLREQVAGALVNKGVTLGQLSRSEEAITVCDDVIARFATAAELPLREQVAKALFNKGIALDQLDRRAEAIPVYDDIVARFGTAAELPLRERVAMALVNKGISLGQLGRGKKAISVYEDVIARFEGAEDPALETIVEHVRTLRKTARRMLKKQGPAPRRPTKARKR